jgi:integrase
MSVHRRGDSFVVSYWQDGRQINKYFGARKFGGSEAAEQAAREWEACRKLQAPGPRGVPTLRDLVLMYGQANNLHRHTRLTIAYILREPAASFADQAADSLTRQDLEALRNYLRQGGRSPATINKAQAYLSAALAWGLEQGLLAIHPWAGYKKLPTKKKSFTATLDDFRRILDVAPDWLRWALAVAYATGNRPGQVELFGLLWTAINWGRGTLRVVQGKSGAPKEVFLPGGFLAEARRRYLVDSEQGYQYMVHRGDGQRIKCYRRAWLRAVKLAGLEDRGLRMYDLRHCVATYLLDAGEPLPVVSKRLGHADPAITAAVYSHALDQRSRHAAESLPPLHKTITDITE